MSFVYTVANQKKENKNYIMNKPISYDLAKLLRDKGFDEFCFYHYYIDGNYTKTIDGDFKNSTIKHQHPLELEIECSAPTISDVVTWLYEKYGIWIQPMIYRRNPNDFIGAIYYNTNNSHFTESSNDPRKAIEAAIEYTLNNLIHI